MRPLSRLVIAFAALASIAACSDEVRHPLAPTSPSNMFAPIPQYDPTFVDLSAGSEHVCVRRKAGPVYCWGDNTVGELGVTTTAICGQPVYVIACGPQPVRVQTSTFTNATSISSSAGYHTCAIVSGGGVFCWGDNYSGEIGNGQMGTDPASAVRTPTLVSGSDAYVAIGAGANETCGVTSTHLLKCWGNKTNLTPTLLSYSANWAAGVNVGGSDACAQSLSGWWGCWGENYQGQLGADPITWPTFEGPINSAATTNATRVRAGNGFICGDQTNGTILCQGTNGLGQLGTSAFTGSMSTAAQLVGGGMQLHNVTTGYSHACALDASGNAFCWGDNAEGMLGIGSVGGVRLDPTPVAGGHLFRDISAGTDFTCGISTDNHLFCWGANVHGQLGQPAAPQHGQSTPIQATDPVG